MNPDDHRDQLIDMLLREVVGGESPPDVRDRVLGAVATVPRKARPRTLATHPKVILPSARASRTPLYAIAAILLLSLTCLGLIHFQNIANARTPTLTSISGSVSRAPGELHSGDTIRTGADSTAVLRYPDGTELEIGADSSVGIPELSLLDRSKSLLITLGGIRAEVATQGPKYPMTLSSDHARAVVVGTKLSFHTSSLQTRLEVTEGEVRMEPNNSSSPLQVTAGMFAEVDSTTSRTGLIEAPPRGLITGFTLMNADSDQTIGNDILKDGQSISLSSLPTKRISLRAECSGERPINVLFTATRTDGKNTGLSRLIPQHHPPFYLTGDFSQDKRPADCRPWTPKPGTYHITAQATFKEGDTRTPGEAVSLTIEFRP